ncbi:hypothetical protein ASJ33_00240 [Dehalococcoides mccartyi]|uniref:hypothetical protein n=1 Tax=Dehalococcoides mccartyi TaxID=61435 RepID=UPI0004E05106|nr:hypothetical protein [Dehalococcoides mccartyi]AII58572.1 hypothetical protein X792_07855 [Dehalococcoides mccartyi CG1]APH11692.1 hypothetical protein ASJ33_00240 [Dehalococcoides mccartyi]
MACFLVVAGEAVITTVVQKTVEKKEKQQDIKADNTSGISWGRKLGWLNKMLWGGTVLLALEHVWHGEVVPWWPFLTAMENPADISPMLHEMATIGGAMALTVTAIWAVMVLVADAKFKASARANNIGAGA